ncbi:kinase-like protein [Coniochaeta ligniaria NRRL 30616]|uniref:Kinase-like protein n=1 Tax=Coniochaeta ligniaria NRRL 30616 TaxID=1408157 RepID=A0A1J7INQ3_9PEZI|nr:kinase-like protein [Coniochaeta ligniaria NRRL 30616]
MTYRICANCDRNLLASSYTSTQLSKGHGYSRCVSCVHGHHTDAPATELYDMGRYNLSESCYFGHRAINNPIAEGTFRVVAKGRYTEGERQGQACVGKWYKWGVEVEDDLFEDDLLAVDKALDVVNRFNQLNVADKCVKINIPDVWDLSNGHAYEVEDEYNHDYEQPILVEPFIQNYQKWNSNSGWFDDGTVWGEVMQALSHFSFHITGGGHVLCDLQGGVYQREVILSDPVILSQFQGKYGATDLGANGITSFFSQHVCNEFCRPNWIYPAAASEFYSPIMGTTMIRRSVPTLRSGPATTRYYR